MKPTSFILTKTRWTTLLLGLTSTLFPAQLALAGTAPHPIKPIAAHQVLAQMPAIADPDPTVLPRVTRERIIQKVQQISGMRLEDIDIVAAEPRTWDGCMGLPNPENPVCTTIAISGWRVIVRAPKRVWIYHTNQDGTDIRLNTAASDYSEGEIVPSFLAGQQIPLIPRPGALLTLVELERKGNVSRLIAKIEIFQDGRVVLQNLAENRSMETVRRLSPEEQAELVKVLQTNQFTSFEGLRYADPRHPEQTSTTIVTPYRAALQYDHSIGGQLPLALQRTIATLVGMTTASSLIPQDIIGNRYAEEIRQALLLELMAGFEDGKFRPDYALTREQLAVLLTRFMQQVPLVNPNQPNPTVPQLPAMTHPVTAPPFRDVAADRWSASRIQYLKELGLMQGYSDNTFRPAIFVTRAELMVALHKTDEYLMRLRNWDGRSFIRNQPPINFADVETHWAQRQIFALSAPCRVAAPVNETGQFFAPNNPALRDYAAAALVRSLRCLSEFPPAS